MLSYAFQIINQGNYDQLACESFENIHDLLGAILAKGISQQLKHGLYKEYIEHLDNSYNLKGKINFPTTINNRVNGYQMLSCNFDELSENNIYNQIIKTTVILLLRNADIRRDTKDTLKKEMLMFSSISELDLSQVHWTRMTFSNANKRYRLLISICQLIYEGLLLTTETGVVKLANYINGYQMSKLYEKFILEFYRKEIPEISANASKIDWQIDGEKSTLLPSMQSDIMLKYKSKTLIIDAKFYSHILRERFDKKILYSANLYQIFTYVKNEDINHNGNVEGLLLYAKTDEDLVPDTEVVLSGNKISAKTLDLNCNFEVIKRQLIDIATSSLGL